VDEQADFAPDVHPLTASQFADSLLADHAQPQILLPTGLIIQLPTLGGKNTPSFPKRLQKTKT